MSKFYCVETGEEIKFGEEIGLTFDKKLEDGCITIVKNIEVNEDNIKSLIALGLIEEDNEDRDLIDYDEDCEALNDLIEDFEALEDRVEILEGIVKDLKNKMCAAAQPKQSKK